MKDEIVLVRLICGDYIIGKLNAGMDKLTLKDPRLIIMAPMQTGEMGVFFKPICYPFTSQRLKEEVELYNSQVEFMLYDQLNEIDKQFIDGYQTELSGIQIASQADLNSLNNKDTSGLII